MHSTSEPLLYCIGSADPTNGKCNTWQVKNYINSTEAYEVQGLETLTDQLTKIPSVWRVIYIITF